MPEIIGEKVDEKIVHPCPTPLFYNTSLLLNNRNMNDMLSENSLNKTIVKYVDTSEVTDMQVLFKNSEINAVFSS